MANTQHPTHPTRPIAFTRTAWRHQVSRKLDLFARNPQQDMHITMGTTSLLTYLAVCTLEPFVLAFEHEPIAAIQTLAGISRAPGADALVRLAPRLRYQAARITAHELRINAEWRELIEHILVAIDTLPMARQRLQGWRAEWFCTNLAGELNTFPPSEFCQLRQRLQERMQSFHDIFREIRQRKGKYTQEDLILLYVGLNDSAVSVRAEAARGLGEYASVPPEKLVVKLIQVAVHDSDMEPRNASARALGALRDRLDAPHLFNQLAHELIDHDTFVRTATAMLLSELGEVAGTDILVKRLLLLLQDPDVYAREAAAHALGRMGISAAQDDSVIELLVKALDDRSESVHTAALESLTRLRTLRKEHTTIASNAAPAPEEA